MNNNLFFRKLVKIGTLLTLVILVLIIGYIGLKGFPHLNIELVGIKNQDSNISIIPPMIATIYLILISLSIALPFGIFTSIYLVEYARQDSKIISLLRLAVETLSGIPSIIYGLFGMIFFVTRLKLGFSILAASLSLSIMILPMIISSAEEALLSVPLGLREASRSLGVSKIDTIFRIVLPQALPGIMSGVILSIGRIIGETAVVIYTAGTVFRLPISSLDSARSLSVHMYVLSSEGLYMDEASGVGFILLIMIFILNKISSFLIKRKKGENYE